MEKRHFEWAAKRVQAMGPCNLHGHDECNRCAAERAYVELFREFGPRFDEARFLEACMPKRKGRVTATLTWEKPT